MADKPSFEFSDYMKMFEPENVAKMFDPKQFLSAFDNKVPDDFDMSSLLETNKRNFDAMLAANKAAAAVSKDFYERQMAIFEELTKSANEHFQSLAMSPGPDAASRQAEIYGAAVEKALEIMTEQAEATRKVNESTLEIIKDRLATAVKDLKQL